MSVYKVQQLKVTQCINMGNNVASSIKGVFWHFINDDSGYKAEVFVFD